MARRENDWNATAQWGEIGDANNTCLSCGQRGLHACPALQPMSVEPITPRPEILPRPQKRCPKCGAKYPPNGYTLYLKDTDAIKQECCHCHASQLVRPLDYRPARDWSDEPPRWAVWLSRVVQALPWGILGAYIGWNSR